MRFADRDAVKIWMLVNQLQRRNLTGQGRGKILAMLHKIEKSKSPTTGPQPVNTEKNRGAIERQCVAQLPGKASERVAEQTGVSARTVERVVVNERVSAAIRAADPRLADQLESGDVKV